MGFAGSSDREVRLESQGGRSIRKFSHAHARIWSQLACHCGRVLGASLAELVRTMWQVKSRFLAGINCTCWFIVVSGPIVRCFLACQVKSAFPEEKHCISLFPITNGDDGALADDSEVSHFSSLTRNQRSGMWMNVFLVLKFVGHHKKWQFSIPWYRVVLYKCNIFVDNVINQ